MAATLNRCNHIPASKHSSSPVWGYMARGESLLARVSPFDGKAAIDGDSGPTDAKGLRIENLGLPLNLMLAMSAHIVIGDLGACIAAIRPRTTTTSAVAPAQRYEVSELSSVI